MTDGLDHHPLNLTFDARASFLPPSVCSFRATRLVERCFCGSLVPWPQAIFVSHTFFGFFFGFLFLLPPRVRRSNLAREFPLRPVGARAGGRLHD